MAQFLALTLLVAVTAEGPTVVDRDNLSIPSGTKVSIRGRVSLTGVRVCHCS